MAWVRDSSTAAVPTSSSETAPATAATSSPVSRAVNSAHAAHSRKTVAAPIAVPALCRAVHGRELRLDDVGHRLDDVVVDLVGRDVDGLERQHGAVGDALGGEAAVGVDEQPAAGDEPEAVGGVAGVEHAELAGELGHQLDDRDAARHTEIRAARARRHGHPHQGCGGAGLAHVIDSPPTAAGVPTALAPTARPSIDRRLGARRSPSRGRGVLPIGPARDVTVGSVPRDHGKAGPGSGEGPPVRGQTASDAPSHDGRTTHG